MKFSIEIGESTWQLMLLAVVIGLALTKRVFRNLVKIVSGFFSVFGWHRNSVWRTGKLQLPSMNPHTGNLTWAKYRPAQFWTWLRQWAFGETRWLPPRNVSGHGTSVDVTDTTRSADSSRTSEPGVVVRRGSDGSDSECADDSESSETDA